MPRRPTADRPQPMRSVRWSRLTERRRTLTRLGGHRVHGSGVRSDPNQQGNRDHDETTDEVIDRFNQAFQERDATLLEDIIAPDCVMESVQPAPDGTRYEGYDASFSSWKALIDDTTSHFEVEDVHTGDEWALIRWRYVWGPGPDDSVRGVNVMRVIDGKIVEAAGYSKTTPVVAALES
jgi:hypothetical protein